MVKLIATDLDKTLLNEKKEIVAVGNAMDLAKKLQTISVKAAMIMV